MLKLSSATIAMAFLVTFLVRGFSGENASVPVFADVRLPLNKMFKHYQYILLVITNVLNYKIKREITTIYELKIKKYTYKLRPLILKYVGRNGG